MEELEILLEMMEPDDLEDYAANYEDAINLDDRPASAYDWEYDPYFPLDEFLKPSAEEGTMDTLERWVNWFKNENAGMEDPFDSDEGRWGYLAKEDIRDPVIVVYNEQGQWHIWDGWHRTAASFAANREGVPAVIGTPKPYEPAMHG
jgi:hypothetical protein